jgi:two-component system, response regulator
MVILLDINPARMDGLEMLRRLRTDIGTHLLPVVILTSSNEEQDLIEGYASEQTPRET